MARLSSRSLPPVSPAGLAVLAALLVAACTSPNESALATRAPVESPAPAGVNECPSIELRTPSGERIDLNGTWVTEKEGVRGGIYYVRHIGSCMWFVGGFADPEETDVPGPLSWVTPVFHGLVAADFTIRGDWVDVRDLTSSVGRGGSMELGIEIDEADVVHLVYLEGTGQPFIEPGYREEQSWVKVSDGWAYPPPQPETP